MKAPKDFDEHYLTGAEARQWLDRLASALEEKCQDGRRVKLSVGATFHHLDWEWMKQQPSVVRNLAMKYTSAKLGEDQTR